MNRRTLLIGAGAVAVGAVAGIGGVSTLADHAGFLGAILRARRPGVQISDATIAAFAAAYWPRLRERYGARILLVQAVVEADRRLPFEADRVEVFERDVLTNFLIGSNFFQSGAPRAARVQFIGLPMACGNPFRQI